MSRIFEFGAFRLDPEARVMTADGRPVPLGPRAVAVLALLVENANRYVPKDRILEAAWPGVVVEEGNLSVQISAIRRVLGRDGDHRIETLSRRGYRFVGAVAARFDAPPEDPFSLAVVPTSFVGREREIVALKRLLPSARLVTIAGIGGIGKTRLAVQVAAEVVDAYRDGVRLVELAALRDPTRVVVTVARALGLEERAASSPAEALGAYLKRRQMLLVLDNCEHLLGACAELADTLLRLVSDTTIVATSREPLRVAGEQTLFLAPLSLPELGERDPELVRRSEAVQLFEDRVRRQLPEFELTPERAPAVADICIHLDGIPLALELAAARARSLSVEQIATRLGERFRLLTGGARTALPRQQTLRATLDWSYDLLAEDERVVLRRLSVFPASFDVDAAAAVAADARIDAFAVVDVLSQLVSRSLVIADTSAAATRYRMLETTRAYAAEKLAEGDDVDTCRRRHAEHYCAVLDRPLWEWTQMSDAEMFSVYVPEFDNVLAALDWALADHGDPALGVALAGASGALWMTVGRYVEGVGRLEQARARIDASASEAHQARLWHWLARLAEETPARSRVAFEHALALYRRLNDPLGIGISLARMARVLVKMGRFDEAKAALEESRPLLESGDPPRAQAFYYFNLAFLQSQSGDPAAARVNYERALTLDRAAGNEYGVLAGLANLAIATWALGNVAQAEALLQEHLARTRASRAKTDRMLGWALLNLAHMLTLRGKLDEALVAAREGVPLLAEDGTTWVFEDALALRAALAGKLTAAARLAGHATRMYEANEAARHPVEESTRARLDAYLRDALPADELHRELAAGARMSGEDACRLAIEG